VAPRGSLHEGDEALKLVLTDEYGGTIQHAVKFGEIKVLPLREDASLELTVQPLKLDVGAGRGKPVTRLVKGGILGVIIDARGRPLRYPNRQMELIDAEPPTASSEDL
jgi:hypothetical protein